MVSGWFKVDDSLAIGESSCWRLPLVEVKMKPDFRVEFPGLLQYKYSLIRTLMVVTSINQNTAVCPSSIKQAVCKLVGI